MQIIHKNKNIESAANHLIIVNRHHLQPPFSSHTKIPPLSLKSSRSLSKTTEDTGGAEKTLTPKRYDRRGRVGSSSYDR